VCIVMDREKYSSTGPWLGVSFDKCLRCKWTGLVPDVLLERRRNVCSLNGLFVKPDYFNGDRFFIRQGGNGGFDTLSVR
jgi:hypothetical protein